MKELENLLTSLVERGRKPFWKERCFKVERVDKNTYEVDCGNIWYRYSLRQLTSTDSWLREFCVRNELLTIENFWEWKFIFDGVTFNYYKSSPKFRLLESTLIPEEELAKFLVDNIIITCNSK